jgi:acyl-coenzyme A synthetase/AMP-(fatty) acid ligase
VNIAGKRTSLAHLNYHLNSIEGVRDGAFVVPDDDGSGAVTRLAAFVVAPGLGREALLRQLRQRIDDAFLPRPLCFVDSLPRNDTGKLPRQAVAELITSAVAGEP